MAKITSINNYIICFIDIQNNKTLITQFNIKDLPTSIIISNNQEETRHSGYSYKEYSQWIYNNNHGDKTWSNLSY